MQSRTDALWKRLTVASLIVRFILSTWPLVQGCFGLVVRWSMSFLAQAYSKACARKRSPLATASLISGTADPPPPGVGNWMPLSVSTVWILQGTASISRSRKYRDVAVLQFSCSSTETNLPVRPIATSPPSYTTPGDTIPSAAIRSVRARPFAQCGHERPCANLPSGRAAVLWARYRQGRDGAAAPDPGPSARQTSWFP